ncbi:WG repeat-containing protein [Flavobacterium tegetincola]|uniref:WG repeat-containing protein n=1 Tax=Flavobacterium tegetincola TaxID=150172 RepID=UPI0004068165|nr:WG repeat-containing protein [Flavobacterium tegetincola]
MKNQKLNSFILILIFLLIGVDASAQNQETIPELYPINDKKVGLIGYYLEDRTNVVKPQFCTATYNIDGYYLVSISKHEYDEDGRRKEEHIPNTEKYALLDARGNFVISFSDNYNYIIIDSGLIKVEKDKRYGILDAKKKVMIPLIYEELEVENKQIILAKKKNKMGVLNLKNEVIIPFLYDKIYGFSSVKSDDNFYLIVSKDGKSGIIDKQNHFVIALGNHDFQFVTKKSIGLKIGNKFKLVDFNLKPILNEDFDTLYLVNIDGDEIYAEARGVGFYFTLAGELLRKDPLEGEKVIEKP